MLGRASILAQKSYPVHCPDIWLSIPISSVTSWNFTLFQTLLCFICHEFFYCIISADATMDLSVCATSTLMLNIRFHWYWLYKFFSSLTFVHLNTGNQIPGSFPWSAISIATTYLSPKQSPRLFVVKVSSLTVIILFLYASDVFDLWWSFGCTCMGSIGSSLTSLLSFITALLSIGSAFVA